MTEKIQCEDCKEFYPEEEIERNLAEVPYCKDCIEREAEKFKELINKDETKREATEVQIIERVYDHVEKYTAPNTYFRPVYSIYSFKTGNGNTPYFLIRKPYNRINKGKANLYLETKDQKDLREFVSSRPKPIPIKQMAKEVGIRLTKENNTAKETIELVQDLVEYNTEVEPIFYTDCLPIKEEELKELTDEQATEYINDYLTDGLQKDENLMLLFKSDLLQASFEVIRRPNHYQQYNDHKLIYTNSKTGKTSTAQKSGEVSENSSIANLLGYATADKIKEGTLNEQTKPFAIDEVQGNKEEELYGHLLTVMEQGKTTIMKGKINLETKTLSSIKFMGNPPRTEEDNPESLSNTLQDALLLQSLEDALRKITRNTKAFSTRIATTLYSNNIMETEGTGFAPEKSEEIQAYVHTITELLKKPYSELFNNKEVRNWLNTKHTKEYIELLELVINGIEGEEEDKINIRNYIRGQTANYRHLRGQALKLAVLEKPMSFMRGDVSVKELLKIAEDKANQLRYINLESFKAMRNSFSALFDTKFREQVLKNAPKHIKVLLRAVSNWQEQAEEKEKLLTKEELKPFVIDAMHEFNEKRSVNQFWIRLFTSLNHNNKTLSHFGILLTRISGGLESVKLGKVIEVDTGLEVEESNV